MRGVSYTASSDFAHRRVLINIDPILTKQKLKHLVCHEVYPGHFMQFTLRRQAWEQGVGGLDGVLSVCNHSSSCTFEGIADAGISFLGWEEGLDDRFPHPGRPGIGCLLPVAHSGLGEQPCGGFPAGQCSWRR